MGMNLKQTAAGGMQITGDEPTDKGLPVCDFYPGSKVKTSIIGTVVGGSANSGVAVSFGNLPGNAMITRASFYGVQNANAGTTGTLSVGFSGGSYVGTELINAQNVNTSGTGKGAQYPNLSGSSIGSTISTTGSTPVVGTYTETGTASTQGGPWIVDIEYVKTGP